MMQSTADHVLGQELDATAHLSEIPLANSQESSFNDSVPSQSSPPRPMSSIQYQLSRGNYSARQITPSTSSSDPSSQGRSAERLKENLSAEDDVPDYSRPELQDGQNERPQNFYTSGSDGEHIHSQKRMADGQVKHASSSLPMSPVEVGRPHGRSDGGSVTSKSSQMGEVCSPLFTYSTTAKSLFLCATSCPIISRHVFPTPWSRSRMAGRPVALMSSKA